ncbi:acyl-homoserine-lactone synthase [Litchfieldella rifensis]|uniref:Acyl-homoserine-lactone synthase n=1 Tax=Litchfieldella rifensis TaxID=762643 RepID=A0ABV7LLA1_9GAMM
MKTDGITTYVSDYKSINENVLKQIFHCRKSVFIDRRKWDIGSYDDGELEVDDYDDVHSYYLYTWHEGVTGCVRLRPSHKPTLLSGPLQWIRSPIETKETQGAVTWEASRFFITPRRSFAYGFSNNRIDARTLALFDGMINFAIASGIDSYEVVVDSLMERVLRRSGWKLNILNSGVGTQQENVYYGLLDCSIESYQSLKRISDILSNSKHGKGDSDIAISSSISQLSSAPA